MYVVIVVGIVHKNYPYNTCPIFEFKSTSMIKNPNIFSQPLVIWNTLCFIYKCIGFAKDEESFIHKTMDEFQAIFNFCFIREDQKNITRNGTKANCLYR